jgi:hypothetical protein
MDEGLRTAKIIFSVIQKEALATLPSKERPTFFLALISRLELLYIADSRDKGSSFVETKAALEKVVSKTLLDFLLFCREEERAK